MTQTVCYVPWNNIWAQHWIQKNLWTPRYYHINYFAHEELRLNIDPLPKNTKKVTCLIPFEQKPQDYWITLSFLVHQLRIYNSSLAIDVHIPYVAYARQVYDTHGLWAFFVQRMIALSCKIILYDPHEIPTEDGIIVRSGTDFWNKFLQKKNLTPSKDHMIFVDQGAYKRYHTLAKTYHLSWTLLQKNRTHTGITYDPNTPSIPYKNLWIIDDIMDSGETLKNAVNMLHRSHHTHITLCITHLLSAPPEPLVSMIITSDSTSYGLQHSRMIPWSS